MSNNPAQVQKCVDYILDKERQGIDPADYIRQGQIYSDLYPLTRGEFMEARDKAVEQVRAIRKERDVPRTVKITVTTAQGVLLDSTTLELQPGERYISYRVRPLNTGERADEQSFDIGTQ